MEGTDIQHTCGPECVEEIKRYRKDVADNLISTTQDHRRAEVIEASRVAADMIKQVLPTFDNDARALVLEFCAGVLAKVMTTPVVALSEVVDTTMVAYSVAAAIVSVGYEPPTGEQRELPAPSTPDEALPEIDLRQTGQYL